MNRQTAVAHQRVFEEIEAIVKEDAGGCLKWRHLHGIGPDDGHGDMILSWTADQHRGQAKGESQSTLPNSITMCYVGLGFHLQTVASNMPPKADLHQPYRNIQDLTPYEHPEYQKMCGFGGGEVAHAKPCLRRARQLG